MHNRSLKTWEFALFIGFVLALTVGAYAEHGQRDLSDKLLRLHVIAASDTPEDQALKLKVRDRVLTETGAHLATAHSAKEAMALLESALPHIEQAARDEIAREGYDYPVMARLTEKSFPTKAYTGFSLPAGDYESLQIIIGDGTGQNWWCVVFPPLCNAAAEDELTQAALGAGLTGSELKLITQDEPVYVVKFKALEIWDSLKHVIKGDK